jgi:hypothetical protein
VVLSACTSFVSMRFCFAFSPRCRSFVFLFTLCYCILNRIYGSQANASVAYHTDPSLGYGILVDVLFQTEASVTLFTLSLQYNIVDVVVMVHAPLALFASCGFSFVSVGGWWTCGWNIFVETGNGKCA